MSIILYRPARTNALTLYNKGTTALTPYLTRPNSLAPITPYEPTPNTPLLERVKRSFHYFNERCAFFGACSGACFGTVAGLAALSDMPFFLFLPPLGPFIVGIHAIPCAVIGATLGRNWFYLGAAGMSFGAIRSRTNNKNLTH